MKVWMQAALGLWLAAWALSGHAAEKKVPPTPEQAGAAAIDTFRQAQANLRRIQDGPYFLQGLGQVKSTCGELGKLDKELATLGPADAKAITAQAKVLIDTQMACDEAKREQQRLDALRTELLNASMAMLRTVASDLDQCKGGDAPTCQAERLGGTVGRLALALTPGVSVGTLDKARQEVVDVAAKAQAQVNEIKATTADAYQLGDQAKVTVFKNKAADYRKLQGEGLRNAARQGDESASATRRAVAEAQIASNVLVSRAIELLPDCEVGDADCLKARARVQAEASAADFELASSLNRAAQSYQRTKEANWQAAAGEYGRLADRRKSIAFARLLDAYPDARSLVGETNAAQINTSGDGTDATIKISLGKSGLGSWRNHAITLKAPLGERERVRSPVSLGYSSYWLSTLDKGAQGKDVSWLWVAGFAPKVDFLTHEYRDPTRVEEPITNRAREWTLSTYFGWYRLHNKSPDLHLLSIDVKRDHKHVGAEIRCPAPVPDKVATCVESEFTAPEKKYSRLLRYQWRTQFGSYPLSPTLSYDQRTKEKRLEVPIYLWRPEGKDQPFNAGIKLDIGSKSADRVGFFVGTNFDLYGLPDR